LGYELLVGHYKYKLSDEIRTGPPPAFEYIVSISWLVDLSANA